jgi:hypothetical protein
MPGQRATVLQLPPDTSGEESEQRVRQSATVE